METVRLTPQPATQRTETPPPARCVICGRDEWTSIRTGSDLCRPELLERFHLARCTSCGHVVQNPEPSESVISAAYSVADDYNCYRPAWRVKGWPLWKLLRQWTTHRRLKWLKRYGTGSDLLEVGCGAGDFLLAAHAAGWNVRAVEYNRALAEAIVDELGFDVRSGDLISDTWHGEQFDVVVFWNVLEHLRSAALTLSTAAYSLRPGGKVLLNIPTRQSAESGNFFGQYWAYLDLPRHLHFYDRETLSQVCAKAGLHLTVYKTPFVQSAWGYYMSSLNWAKRIPSRPLQGLSFLCISLIVTLLMPYVALQALCGRGMEAVAVAVRPR